MNIIEFIKNRYINISSSISNQQLPAGSYLYLNPFNYFSLRKKQEVLDSTHYVIDGIYLVALLRFFLPASYDVTRQSFDMTSIAPIVLDYFSKNNLKVFVAGGKDGQSQQFIQIMQDRFIGIDWIGYCDGYQNEDDIIRQITESGADAALLGLGNIKQESVAARLAQLLPNGYFFTCGAFVSQTASANGADYYPEWIDRLQLRWVYRFYKEPHVIKRVVIYYPAFIACFIVDLFKDKSK